VKNCLGVRKKKFATGGGRESYMTKSCINSSLPNIIWVVDKWTKNIASVVTAENARVYEV
jgi:hypothetical protein